MMLSTFPKIHTAQREQSALAHELHVLAETTVAVQAAPLPGLGPPTALHYYLGPLVEGKQNVWLQCGTGNA